MTRAGRRECGNARVCRAEHIAVVYGKEMIVFGGLHAQEPFGMSAHRPVPAVATLVPARCSAAVAQCAAQPLQQGTFRRGARGRSVCLGAAS
jgi:hypothetical protein